MVTHKIKQDLQKAGQQTSRLQSSSRNSARPEKMLLTQERPISKGRNNESKQPSPSPTSNTPTIEVYYSHLIYYKANLYQVFADRESRIKAKTITKRSCLLFYYHSFQETITIIHSAASQGVYNLREYSN